MMQSQYTLQAPPSQHMMMVPGIQTTASVPAPAIRNDPLLEVFVGNLSFFCDEQHLFELFNNYANVKEVRIVRNDSGTRSLMFGFVKMATAQEAREMCKLLNGHLFMGRNLK